MIYFEVAPGLEQLSLSQAPNLEGRASGGQDMDFERVRQALL